LFTARSRREDNIEFERALEDLLGEMEVALANVAIWDCHCQARRRHVSLTILVNQPLTAC